jgi:hypothetical protein
MDFQQPGRFLPLALFLIVTGTSFVCGILVMKRMSRVLAAVNLIFAIAAVFLLLVANAFASFT